MKPTIGILSDYDYDNDRIYLNATYCSVILEAGAIPLIIPSNDCRIGEDIIQKIDGLLFTGGTDIDPKYFDEPVYKFNGTIKPDRDTIELNLAQTALHKHIPTLGICRGMQIMAVAAGCDIYQDIYSQIDNIIIQHSQKAPKWYGTHEIYIEKDTIISHIYEKESIYVNSYHHQAVRNISSKVIVSAVTEDNIIEAIEGKDHPWYVGVQWHPECMYSKDILQLNLFKEFIKSCKYN